MAIFDEPTNHLDADTITWLQGFLANEFPGSVLLVTHDRCLLDSVATRVLGLEDGRVIEHTKRNDNVGTFEDFFEQKAEQYAHAERVESNRLSFVKKEIDCASSKRFRRSQAASALASHGRSRSRQEPTSCSSTSPPMISTSRRSDPSLS